MANLPEQLDMHLLSKGDTVTIAQIVQLAAARHVNPWQADELVDFLNRPGNDVLVMRAPDTKVIGFVAYTEMEDEHKAKVADIQVHPDYLDKTFAKSRHVYPKARKPIVIEDEINAATHLMMHFFALTSRNMRLDFSGMVGDTALAAILQPFEGREEIISSGPVNLSGLNHIRKVEKPDWSPPAPEGDATLLSRITQARRTLTEATGVEWRVVRKRINNIFNFNKREQQSHDAAPENLFLCSYGPVENLMQAHASLQRIIGIYPIPKIAKHDYRDKAVIPATMLDPIIDAGMQPRSLANDFKPKRLRGQHLPSAEDLQRDYESAPYSGRSP